MTFGVQASTTGSCSNMHLPYLAYSLQQVLRKILLTCFTFAMHVQNTEEEAHEQLSYSFDLGVNTLDTAEIYPVRCSFVLLATATLSWSPLLCIHGASAIILLCIFIS